MSEEPIKVGNKLIGDQHPPFVIAEMSGNHAGSLARALEIVDAVADSGADALKIQTYTADSMTLDVDLPEFRVGDDHPLWGGRALWSLYDEARTPYEWHQEIFERARVRGLVAFSSPFDIAAVEFLEDLNAPLYKIASLEIADLNLITRAAETGKPIIFSTGAATLRDVDNAVRAIRATGNNQIVVLGCTSSYPAIPGESNLRSLDGLRNLFGTQVGFSDHTLGTAVSVAAVALGARVIEKHVTLSREDGAVDSEFSLEPHELKTLVHDVRDAFDALGSTVFESTESEAESRRSRRSLYVTADVEAGEVAGLGNIRAVRPGRGLEPSMLIEVTGRKFTQSVSAGTPVSWDLFSERHSD